MITRKEIIDRAMTWVEHPVPYSMTRFKDGWRTDCSGFVSMAWNLGRNYWTGNLHEVGARVPFTGMKPGDMLLYHNPHNPSSGSHVVLFYGWVNRPGGDFAILEQTGSGNRGTRRILWSGTGRRNLAMYLPYRPLNLAPDVIPKGEQDMQLILGNVKGQATVWVGLRGVADAYAFGNEESMAAVQSAGAVRREFSSAEAMLGALGAEAHGDEERTLQRMRDAR
jgi:hypothetical protein